MCVGYDDVTHTIEKSLIKDTIEFISLKGTIILSIKIGWRIREVTLGYEYVRHVL